MLFTFNVVDLCVVTLQYATEVCRAIECNKKTSKIAHIVMTYVSTKNYPHKCRLSKVLLKNMNIMTIWLDLPWDKMNIISLKKECASGFLQGNSLKQKNLESIAVTQCSHMFGSRWPRRWKKSSKSYHRDPRRTSVCQTVKDLDNHIRAIQFENVHYRRN